ncbi:MAG TPA: hypothetical protein VJC08_02600 [bacterium]|nr:hypothetical protein [bacterium]
MSDHRKKKSAAADFEIQFYEGIIKSSPHYIEALIPLAEAYTRKGLYRKGLEIDKRLAALCGDDPVVFYNLACSRALVGHNKEAMAALKQAVKLGYRDFNHLLKDPDLKSLNANPAFKKWLSSL